ncbi:hypothetical protein LTR70_009422 [Exophiala xenobiotica]|uniref:Glutathione S-transferase n=1 Tax=Lithohypha guttulata TaxID=1690604 RepID=A0ABR0JXI4_9EURO|nr:hypothetical protein LTR24_009257 [Lithohypha guttulata]KAK5310519.1 hypothetical protein LTR70_009422 [Exophiala xenobiotica]
MSSIKLWYSPGACSLATHILLKETGTEFEGIRIGSKQGLPDEFRRINPRMKVPVLSVDGEIITETPAIMTAISQLSPDRHLFGTSDTEIVKSYEWSNWLSGTVHGQGFGGLFRPARFSDVVSMHAAIQDKGWKTVQECFEIIEAGLSAVHAVGKNFTVVDPYLYVFYRWGVDNGADMAARYPKYARLVVELMKRPAVLAALEAEGILSHAPKLSDIHAHKQTVAYQVLVEQQVPPGWRREQIQSRKTPFENKLLRNESVQLS